MIATRIRTTDGAIALANLDAQIESLERQAAQGRLMSRWWADLVDRDLRGDQARGAGALADHRQLLHRRLQHGRRQREGEEEALDSR